MAARSKSCKASLDAPKVYQFLVYLQHGPAGMNRGWDLGWDNGNKDVTVVNPAFGEAAFKPVIVAGELEEAIKNGKPPEVLAEIRERSVAALVAAMDAKKNFAMQEIIQATVAIPFFQTK